MTKYLTFDNSALYVALWLQSFPAPGNDYRTVTTDVGVDDDYDDEEEEEEDEDEEDDDELDEKKLDSGNYDGPSSSTHSNIRMQREMAAVKEAMIQENTKQGKTNLSDDSGNESPVSPNKRKEEARKQSGFINFSAAKERNKVQIAAKAANSRGSELLQMIRLDVVDFDLFDLPPIRYEAFMKTFGSSNSQQTSTQTGDDNLEVEVQTEEYQSVNKWTQKPPTFGQKTDMEDIDSVRGNLLGVGGDNLADHKDNIEYKQNENSLRLAKFLCGSGQALLAVLEEDQARREGEVVEGLPQRDIDFADSITVLRVEDTPCLTGKPVTLVEFSPDNPLCLVTVHGRDDNLGYVCQWHVSRPQKPLHILKCSSPVTSVCMSGHFIIGGCSRGETVMWDTRESVSMHHQVTPESEQGITRSPTFTNTEAHTTRVTSIRHLASPHHDPASPAASQLLSLELVGQVVVWTVLDTQKDYEQHLGLAHWGQVLITHPV